MPKPICYTQDMRRIFLQASTAVERLGAEKVQHLHYLEDKPEVGAQALPPGETPRTSQRNDNRRGD